MQREERKKNSWGTKRARWRDEALQKEEAATSRAGLSWRARRKKLLSPPSFFFNLCSPPHPHQTKPKPTKPQDPLFAPNSVHGLSLAQNRDLTLERLLRYVRKGQFFSVRDYGRDPRRFMAGLESLALVDYSLCIKAGVHFTL
jgi:hypothetical protein